MAVHLLPLISVISESQEVEFSVEWPLVIVAEAEYEYEAEAFEAHMEKRMGKQTKERVAL